MHEKLKPLYKRLPEIDCLKCANCCTKLRPAFGIAEFISFCRHLLNDIAKEDIIKIVNKKMPLPGCRFLGKDNLCTVRDYRPFACRIFGVKVLYKGRVISDYHREYTTKDKNKPVGPAMPLKRVHLLVKRLDDINSMLYPVKAPFWIRGLTFDAWLSLYMSNKIKGARLKRLQSILHKNLDLEFLRCFYEDGVDIVRDFEQFLKNLTLFKKRRYKEAFMGFFIPATPVLEDYASAEKIFYCGMCLEALGNLKDSEDIYETVFIKTLYINPALAKKAKKRIECLKRLKG
ncbi:MAG TPA: hypothetical protein ENN78_01755 [Candidatus Omnitrophica bacterium]|nr:hypothetical protein [Candidatus Omnitrophota bacterium]